MTRRLPSDLVPAVDEAVAAGVLAEVDDKLLFRHGLIRSALYESMPRSMRTALHRQAARAMAAAGLPIARIAAQLLAAGQEIDNWTVDWLLHNGAMLAECAPLPAQELLLLVEGWTLPRRADRHKLDMSLATAAYRHGNLELAEKVGRRMLSKVEDSDQLARVVWLLARTLLFAGRAKEAHHVVRDFLEKQRLTSPPPRLRALHARTLMVMGDYQRARVEAADALQTAREAPDWLAVAMCNHVMATVAMISCNTSEAVNLVDQALAVIDDVPEGLDEYFSLLVDKANWSDDARDSRAALARMRTMTASDTVIRVRKAAVTAAVAHFRTGRWDDALAELETVDTVGRKTFDGLLSAGLRSLIMVQRGDQRLLNSYLAELNDRHLNGVGRANAKYLLLAEALAAEQSGDPKRALKLLAPTVSPEDRDMAGPRNLWLPYVVRLALAEQDPALARHAAEVAVSDARTEIRGRRATTARWCTALLTDDVAALDSCAEYFREVGWLPSRASVCADAAVAAAAQGDPAGARRRIAVTAELFDYLGWDLSRADAQLRARGIRRGRKPVRGRPDTGWAALTATELRVAELIAEGASNPSIAGTLYLSRRTVQTHVTHILAKLKLSSRVDIAREAANGIPVALSDGRHGLDQ